MEFLEIEKKWQAKWEKEKVFESNPSAQKKFYLTAAFPYPNSPQHIGHARTYTTTDSYARFKRMSGFNVLLPMGFHVTGTPILGMAKRLEARDKEIMDIFTNIYKVPESKLRELTKPEPLVAYFSAEIEQGMKEMGFSIDWRRKFYSYDKIFNAFITWQFEKLKEKELITKGKHPVPWCPSCNNAVGAHDTQGDKDPDLEEYVLLKFKFKEGVLVCATFRPETLYGVTNIWYNPKAEYVKARIKSEVFYVSKEAAEKLGMQAFEVEILETLSGSTFQSAECENPLTHEKVPLYPASFVDPKNGSGVVMSVPAHAPYDFLALRDYLGSKLKDSMLKQVIKIEGYGNAPAKEICEKMNIANQDDPKAEEATHEIYKKEAHGGVMIIGKYTGQPVIKAKDLIRDDMLAENSALMMHEIVNGPIFCRCGALAAVKIVEDQWFINYGSAQWKELAKECLIAMEVIPKKTRSEYEYTIDWLREKACTRASGLGTKFPFADNLMIEALSDSTIYMAFYTIAHKLKKLGKEPTSAMFDYIFLGKESPAIKADKNALDEMKREFDYWYPLDSRHSGGDLIRNHLTFFIFNHVGVFPRERWPKQIAVNGFVLMDGKKMSKSMGNILPLREAIKKYGADIVRFSVVSGADLAQDSDFNETLAGGISSRLKYMESLLDYAKTAEKEAERPIDKWLRSRLHRRIRDAQKQFEELELRTLTQEILYNTVNDIKWYEKRTSSRAVLREYLENWVLLISPFIPHVAEELWEKLGKKKFVKESKFVSLAEFPKAHIGAIDERAERAEEIIVKTRDDIENISKLIGKKASKIFIYTASSWKRELYKIAFEEKRFDSAMKRAMENEQLKPRAKLVGKLLLQYIKKVNELSSLILTQDEERAVLEDASEFLSNEFKAAVVVHNEEDAHQEHFQKAEAAFPMKPSIFLES
ncbi:MAG: leucine--tRNA ligase [Candidatus Micrarchaeota archaeon]